MRSVFPRARWNSASSPAPRQPLAQPPITFQVPFTAHGFASRRVLISLAPIHVGTERAWPDTRPGDRDPGKSGSRCLPRGLETLDIGQPSRSSFPCGTLRFPGPRCQGRTESTSEAGRKMHQFKGWREWCFGFWQGEREGDLLSLLKTWSGPNSSANLDGLA